MKDWIALLAVTLLSIVGIYYQLNYWAVLPVFLFAAYKVGGPTNASDEHVVVNTDLKEPMVDNTASPSPCPNALRKWLEEIIDVLQICENNLQNICSIHQEAKTNLEQALEHFTIIEPFKSAEQHQHHDAAAINQNLAAVLRALQSDDINMQNLGFTHQELRLLRIYLAKIVAQGVESISDQARQELATIKRRHNSVSSKNLQEGKVELF